MVATTPGLLFTSFLLVFAVLRTGGIDLEEEPFIERQDENAARWKRQSNPAG